MELTISGVIVSCMNPGDVKTDMNLGGVLTAEEGSKTIVYLSLLDEQLDKHIAKGEFWYLMKNYDWSDLNLDLVKIFGHIYDLDDLNNR